jgi:multidrug efflux pump subunit AcrA (membrane-fusion protein)
MTKVFISAIAIFSACQLGCDRGQSVRGNEQPKQVAPSASLTMDVQVAAAESTPHRIPVVGTLHAAEEAVISTRTAGILRRTFVDVGSTVKPDEPLAQVDTLDYEVAVKQAQASLAEVLARLGVDAVPVGSFDVHSTSAVQRAEAQLENARFAYERLRNVGAGGQSVADQEMNDASTRLRVAEADHRLAVDETAALLATARERQALLQMATQRLANTKTKTPPIPTTLGRQGADQWIVAERLVTEGQFLNIADQLYRLIVSNPLKLRSKVPERYAGEVRVGQSVEIEVVGGIAAPQGQIVRVSPVVDPASRMFEIEALIDNPQDQLKPGAFAKGSIAADPRPSMYVSEQAIVTAGGTTKLFIIDNGVARSRNIRLGRQLQGRVEVISGLNDGEHYISKGAANLTDGAYVQPRTGT